MKITDIKYAETGKTRDDGRYPLRIGSTVEFFVKPLVGNAMVLSYISDNIGNPKEGILRTSTILSIYESINEIIITTRNSIYCFEIDHPTEKGGAE